MRVILRTFILFGSVILIFGCAGKQIIQQEIIREEPPKEVPKPDWIDNPPKGYYVGVSQEGIISEQTARNDALKHARIQILDSLGVKIDREIVDEIITKGKTSEILDSEIASKASSVLIANGLLTGTKEEKWFIEKYRKIEPEKVSYFYKAYALVPFSKDEHNKFLEQIAKESRTAIESFLISAKKSKDENDFISALRKYEIALKICSDIEKAFTFIPNLTSNIQEWRIESEESIREIKPKVIQAQIKKALLILSEKIKRKEKIKVGIGEINFESKLSSKFSEYISSEISFSLTDSKNFEEISKKELRQLLEELKISLTGLTEEETMPQTGKMKNIEAIFTGDFWDNKDEVKVNLSLVFVETREKFTTSFVLPKLCLSGIELKPENYDIVVNTIKEWDEIKGGSKELNIKVWTDNPTGIYKKGEKIIICFKSNRNCYLKLFHTDAKGIIKQIFPNLYTKESFITANRVYKIPNESMNFEFVVSEPYGTDVVKAIGSLQKFGEEKVNSGEVFKNFGSNISESTRGIDTIPIELLAVATCTFTTIEK